MKNEDNFSKYSKAFKTLLHRQNSIKEKIFTMITEYGYSEKLLEVLTKNTINKLLELELKKKKQKKNIQYATLIVKKKSNYFYHLPY